MESELAPTERAEAEIDSEVQSLGPALDFLRLLWSVDHALRSSSKRSDRAAGTTAPQQLALRVLSLRPGITSGQIAEALHLHPSTMTGIVQRLERDGMITRKDDSKDARKALLTLSAKGKKSITGQGGASEAAIKKVLAKMPGKVDAARELLSAITAELESVAR